MNQLPLHKRVMILNMLVEGMALRSISRTEDVSINTVTKLLVDAGWACEGTGPTIARTKKGNLLLKRKKLKEHKRSQRP